MGQSSLCDEVAQPLSICQSFSHGGGPSILAATQAGPSSHGRGSASGKLSFWPLLSFWFPSHFHWLLSQLYKLPLFSLLFPQLKLCLWENRGKGGKHAKRCGIYLAFLAPRVYVTRHFALPFTLYLPSFAHSWSVLLLSPYMKSSRSFFGLFTFWCIQVCFPFLSVLLKQ